MAPPTCVGTSEVLNWTVVPFSHQDRATVRSCA
jgi:hypothetical protein